MRILSNLELLQLWERGSDLHPLDRALLTLSTALPHEPYDSLADWPLGRRNTALAEVRTACFGQKMQGWIACPQCGERLEFAMDADALRGDAGEPSVDFRGRSFRLPTSRDLATIASERDTSDATFRLLQRCCIEERAAEEWSEQEMEEAGNRLAEADPMAETRVNLRCTQCGLEWDEPLDIAAWLWTEIEARARRLLLEVHTLASAYGWTEAEILSLSELRRTAYLEMVQP